MNKEQREENLRQGNKTQQDNAKTRLAAAEVRNRGKDPNHPVVGSQAWADKKATEKQKDGDTT